MSVLAVLAPIGTLPEPTILLLLNRFKEELAYDVGLVARLCAMLLLHHLLKLFLIPLIHVVVLIISPTSSSSDSLSDALQPLHDWLKQSQCMMFDIAYTHVHSLHYFCRQPASLCADTEL